MMAGIRGSRSLKPRTNSTRVIHISLITDSRYFGILVIFVTFDVASRAEGLGDCALPKRGLVDLPARHA